MIYTLSIDQPKALEWGLNLSEAAVFSFCYNLPAWADKQIIDEEVYYFASRNKAAEELPLVTDKPDTIYRHYKSLIEKGLILWKKIDGKDYIATTQKAASWNKLGKISEHSEKFPNKLGKISENDSEKFPNKLGKISENDSEKFPTNNNTSIDKNTRDQCERAREENQSLTTYEQTYSHLIDYLKNNTHLVEGVKTQAGFNGKVSEVLKDYLINLQEKEEWFRLRIPKDEGKHQRWIASILAGVTKWAKHRKNNPRNNHGTPSLIPKYHSDNEKKQERRRPSPEAIEKFANSPLSKKLEKICGRKAHSISTYTG